MTIVNRVQESRLAANMSVKLLAQVMAVSEQYIIDLEVKGSKVYPNIQFCYTLARVLEVPLSVLFYEPGLSNHKTSYRATPCNVYILEDTASGVLKIGISESVPKRQATIESASGRKLNRVYTQKYPSRELARAEESRLHNLLSDYRLPGEWFKITYEEFSNLPH